MALGRPWKLGGGGGGGGRPFARQWIGGCLSIPMGPWWEDLANATYEGTWMGKRKGAKLSTCCVGEEPSPVLWFGLLICSTDVRRGVQNRRPGCYLVWFYSLFLSVLFLLCHRCRAELSLEPKTQLQTTRRRNRACSETAGVALLADRFGLRCWRKVLG
ncbi:hypothetical protein GQ53DRAFT_371130 [Thozetella sp. PMI_491]|nr:hypothetical protein GQ53DRAFT_371130 [Thozetella sp. PMI_491]